MNAGTQNIKKYLYTPKGFYELEVKDTSTEIRLPKDDWEYYEGYGWVERKKL